MPPRIKKSVLEEMALKGDDKSNSLTSDLPLRSRQTGKKSKKLVPALVIVAAGVLGFLIPTLQTYTQRSPSDQKVSEQIPADNNDQNNNQTPEVVYVQKSFGTVKPNDVGYLNVRAEGSRTGELLGRLNVGDKVEILEETSSGWSRISLNTPLNGQNTGWVASEYLEKSTEQVPQ